MASKVLAVREAHPTWGGRKIAARLCHLGEHSVPAPSTITAIVHRHDRIDPAESAKRGPWRRFEHAAPNDLWQMDFKGEFKMANGRWCYPLTVLDDHSRFNLALRACGDQKRPTVQSQLTAVFQRYGLPQAMLMDNGTPWSVSHSIGAYTKLSVWLLRLQIRVIRGRPYHPQTQGKEERFHRTLNTELLQGRPFNDLRHSQMQFDPWREIYNHPRPPRCRRSNTARKTTCAASTPSASSTSTAARSKPVKRSPANRSASGRPPPTACSSCTSPATPSARSTCTRPHAQPAKPTPLRLPPV